MRPTSAIAIVALVNVASALGLGGYQASAPSGATATITGHVLDDRGQPVPGLTVAAVQRNSTDDVALVRGSRAWIDEHGRYRIIGVPPGRVFIRTSIGTINWNLPVPGIARDAKPLPRDPRASGLLFVTDESGDFIRFGSIGPMRDGRMFTYVPAFYGATRADAGSPVEVVAGATKNDIDITIRTEPAITIRGTVTGPSGPIANARLQLAGRTWKTVAVSAWSGQDGHYAFLNVPRGDYELTVSRQEPPMAIELSAEGFPGLPQNDASRSGRPMSTSVSMPANARAGDVVTFDVRVDGGVAQFPGGRPFEVPSVAPVTRRPGTTVLDGDVRNDKGDGVANARVVIYGAALGGPRGVVADETGHFSFSGLPAAEVNLLAAAPLANAVEFEQPRAAQPGRNISIADGEHRTITIRVPRAGAISGVITNASGNPMPFAYVTIAFEGTRDRAASVTADENGRYRAYGLAPGDYSVSAISSGEQKKVTVVSGEEARGVDVRVQR